MKNIGAIINNGNIIFQQSKYNGSTIVEKDTFDVGDFVIPTLEASNAYYHTNQQNGWFGCVWRTVDLERTGEVYCLDLFDSYPIKRGYLQVIKPTKEMVKVFFSDIANNDRVDPCAVTEIGKLVDHTNMSEFKSIFDIFVKRCAICGETIFKNRYHHTKEYGDICNSCYEKLFRECEHCGNPFINRIGEDEAFCPKCRKREFILPYHRGYPKVKFFGDNHDNSVPFMGVELEVDDGGHDNENAAHIMRIMNKKDLFIYCSHDGSIEDGFEIITQPATMEYHSSMKGVYSDVFNSLKSMGYCSNDTSTCGLHIHFNRDYFKDNEEECVSKLLYLTEKFWKEIVIFSRRNERRLERFAKPVEGSTTRFYEQHNKSKRHEDHYYAVNISNENTIEFRMFKGTINVDTFMDTLQLVENMVVLAKTKNINELKAIKFIDLLTTSNMKKYWRRRNELRMPNEE